MLPIPTPIAVTAFVGASLALAIGAAAGSFPATVVGAALLLALVVAFVLTVPVGRRVRRQKLELAWWLGHGDPGADAGAAIPRKPFEVRCFLRHRGPERLVLGDLRPLVPGGAQLLEEDAPELLVVPGGTRTEFSFRLVAPATGRVVLHGLAVRLGGPLRLFEVPLYFPNPLVVKVLPPAIGGQRSVVRALTGQPVERPGASLIAVGGGTELKELRDMQPGDSFRAIAWKPSARRGKLLVREVEQEVQETRYLVLDVSGTMRGGAPGTRKLDFVIEAAAAEARRTLARGDQLGLVTVDGRVLAHVPARDGSAQELKVLDALLAATEVVDADLTDVDDDEVVGIVGRYVRQQDGIDFRTARGDWNLTLLARHVSRSLAEGRVEARAGADVHAQTPAGTLLRRFCLVRGIPLPHRPDPRDGVKAPSFATVLHSIAGASRAPTSIALLTDLDGLGDPQPLVAALKLLRGRKHKVVLVVPDATTFHPRPDDPLGGQLWDVYARGEARRVADVSALLGPLGVRVVVVRSTDSPLWALCRAIEGARRSRAA
ncbi:MAG: hypothetical protein OHK0013_05770 [Sandaracinaceae bacterium]